MAIDTELKLKAYELLIAHLEDKLKKSYATVDKNAEEEVERLGITSDFIFRKLGYKNLMELAGIIDEFENNGGSMKDYVESNYSEN